jgi:hypothetical protein
MTSNNFTCNPNSRETLVDRRIYLQNTYQAMFQGNNNTGSTSYLYQPGISGCIRANPIMASLATVSFDLADSSYSTPLNQYFSVFQRYSKDWFLEDRDISICPSMPDKTQSYEICQGTVMNPMGLYASGSSLQDTRGGFPILIINNAPVLNGANGSAVIQFTVTEPLYVSPLYFGHGDKKAIVGVENLTISYLYSDVGRLWSQRAATASNVIPLSNVGIALPAGFVASTRTPGLAVAAISANVILRQLTPRLTTPIPREIAFSFSNIVVNQSPPQLLPLWANAGIIITDPSVATTVPVPVPFYINNITLNTVPELLYIFAMRQEPDRTSYTSDTYGVITKLIVNWEGKQLLSTATQQDLYLLSVRNGLNLSWDEFVNHVGSPIRVNFGRDLGLSSLQAPSLLNRSTLSIEAQVINTSDSAINYALYCIVVESGVTSIIEGHVVKQTGILSQQDILDSENAPMVPDMKRTNVFGSSFFSDLLNGVKQGVNTVADFVPTGIKLFNTAKTLAPLLGLGMSGGRKQHSHKRMYGRGLEEEDENCNEECNDENCNSEEDMRDIIKPKMSEKQAKMEQIVSENKRYSESARNRLSERPRTETGGKLLSRDELLRRK